MMNDRLERDLVYCDECKYFKRDKHRDYNDYLCFHPDNMLASPISKKCHVFRQTCLEKNMNNDCDGFFRKYPAD